MKKHFIIIIIALLSINLTAQEWTIKKDNEFEKRPFQFTFMFPPIGTNGIQSGSIVNQLSLNTFIGISAGTEGIELAGFVNINKYYMDGVQMAGFMNVVGTHNGNTGRHNSEGVQMAGFGNINNNSFTGGVFAGFMNLTCEMEGIQAAGFMNINSHISNGISLAGFTNISIRGNNLVQAAGFLNVGKKVNGAQLAGFTNVAKEVNGVQVAGFANIASYVKGVMVSGFINVADSLDGIPIGFINIVKKGGYRKFELSVNDHSYAQVAFKLGVKRFYNIYTFSKLQGDANRWAYGFGFGYEKDLKKDYVINIEATAKQVIWINDNRTRHLLFIDRTNLLNQLKVSVGQPLGENMHLNLGVTYNVSVSSDNDDPYTLGPEIIPFWKSTLTTYSNHHSSRVRTWIGFSLGLSF